MSHACAELPHQASDALHIIFAWTWQGTLALDQRGWVGFVGCRLRTSVIDASSVRAHAITGTQRRWAIIRILATALLSVAVAVAIIIVGPAIIITSARCARSRNPVETVAVGVCRVALVRIRNCRKIHSVHIRCDRCAWLENVPPKRRCLWVHKIGFSPRTYVGLRSHSMHAASAQLE